MAKKQLYFEDVQDGMEIPTLSKIATSKMLVQWAGASGDFNPLHYEDDFAKANMVNAPIVHGALKRAWLGHLMTDWIGEEGVLKPLSCQYRGMDWPRKMKTFDEPQDGETWHCKGKVIKKYTQDDENLVDCQIWVENGKGETTTPGAATVALPSKKK
ncbi:MAG: hypothetical protein FJZ85_02030 [Chloroflexi bacterium]|nr:hypothetical protein [Chloroflexota bacterium]